MGIIICYVMNYSIMDLFVTWPNVPEESTKKVETLNTTYYIRIMHQHAERAHHGPTRMYAR